MYDVMIIGGGVSGYTAGIIAKTHGLNVVIIEKESKTLQKLLMTGNGKCNLSNKVINCENYNNPLVLPFLKAESKVTEFFKMINLPTKEMDGRIYPYSESAATVSTLIREAFGTNNVISDKDITEVDFDGENFIANGEIFAEKCVISTGSNATKGQNSHNLLAGFGHTVTPLRPALVPLILSDSSSIKGLSGLRAKVKLSVRSKSGVCASKMGELLFKDNGLSGIVSMEISSVIARFWKEDFEAEINFAPDKNVECLNDYKVSGWLSKAIAESVVRQAKVQNRKVYDVMQNFKVGKVRLGDIKSAQVTSGGVALEEFDENLQSTKIKNLYACGEVLDVDGDCGGYNLFWAFVSGLSVGEAL